MPDTTVVVHVGRIVKPLFFQSWEMMARASYMMARLTQLRLGVRKARMKAAPSTMAATEASAPTTLSNGADEDESALDCERHADNCPPVFRGKHEWETSVSI